MLVQFYHLLPEKMSRTQNSGLCVGLTKWKMALCATENTEYQWKYRLSCFSLFTALVSSISLLLHCFSTISFLDVFLAVACFLKRCCAWISAALFWYNFSAVWILVHLTVRVKMSLHSFFLIFLWFRVKGQKWYQAHHVCPCVGVAKLVWENSIYPNHSALHGQRDWSVDSLTIKLTGMKMFHLQGIISRCFFDNTWFGWMKF